MSEHQTRDADIAYMHQLEAERDKLGAAAFAAIVACGEDTDGATTWQAYFRPLRAPSWVDAVHQNVTSLREERDLAEAESLTAEAERDAALSVIARVREVLQPHHDFIMQRAAKFGRRDGDCLCEQCKAWAALGPRITG